MRDDKVSNLSADRACQNRTFIRNCCGLALPIFCMEPLYNRRNPKGMMVILRAPVALIAFYIWRMVCISLIEYLMCIKKQSLERTFLIIKKYYTNLEFYDKIGKKIV